MGSPTKHTEQAIQNWSFDETYQQAAVEILTENAGGTALERQKTIATEETLQKIAGMNYDTTSVDLSDMANIVIVYKLAGVTILTETVTKIGSIYNIVKS